jgi:site-specific DNA-methyltransferase (adenine-specific)
MDLTTDVWELPPESATRVGHPAPFPIELPRRLIDLFTYEGDLVLDPVLGSGSTAVAALRTGRHYIGFDTDPDYVEKAEKRLVVEQASLAGPRPGVRVPASVAPPGGRARRSAADQAVTEAPSPETAAETDAGLEAEAEAAVDQAIRAGRKAKDVALLLLEAAGFDRVEKDVKVAGLPVDLRARDQAGGVWLFDVPAGFSAGNPGLRRSETFWRALGKASALAGLTEGQQRYVLFTVELPVPSTPAARSLAAVLGTDRGKTIADVIRLLDDNDRARLASHAQGLVP